MSQQEDIISRHSDSLCQFFNVRYPETVMALARSYTKQNIPTAEMIQIWREGFTILGQDEQGIEFEVSISFSQPADSLSAVKEVLLQMGEKAEGDAPRSCYRQIPGQPPGWRVYWPNWNWFLIFLATGVCSFSYICLFPDTQIWLFRWTIELLTLDTIRTSLRFAFGLHVFQAMTAFYLMKRVAKYKFSLKQTIIWTICVQVMGIGSILKLLPIVYNSKFVSDEIDEDNKRLMEVNEV